MGKRSSIEKTRQSPATSVTTHATAEGTQRYASSRARAFVSDFYRTTKQGLTASSIAIGTYLGESDDETDARYADALRAAFSEGINVVDTAINYRCQRSERVIGQAMQDAIGAGTVRRDEILLCTKGGYVPLDGSPPASRAEYAAYMEREYFGPGIVAPEDVVAGGHSIAPAFLENQLQRSLRNLGVQSVDCFYVHNPEQQLAAVAPDELARRLRAAFEMLEGCVSRGVVGVYGCATWNGLRLPDASHGHLSLFELAALAEEAGGKDHHFRMVQLPINLSMAEAVRISTQRDPRGRLVHVVDAASMLGIDIVASAPLLQGQLTTGLPDGVRELFPGTTDAQRALAFVRSVSPVVSVAVGTRSTEHVRENLAGLRA